MEKGGVQIEKMLTVKNPFKNEKCEEKWCPLCKFNHPPTSRVMVEKKKVIIKPTGLGSDVHTNNR